jgi:uncharacterized protein
MSLDGIGTESPMKKQELSRPQVFDLPQAQTYYTRPMPGRWSKLRDVARLADERAEFEFEIPVGELPGFPAELSAADGPVHVRLRFGREQGFAVADVAIRGALSTSCQRCLGPMQLLLATGSRVAVVQAESAADAVPAEWETFLAADGRLSIPALVAEELLLALPIVPLHGAEAACGAAIEAAVTPAGEAAPQVPGRQAEAETQRPFADLRKLLDRGGRSSGMT